MDRKIDQKLEAWKAGPRRKPLLLLGARQVGKTYALKKFAAASYKNFVYFNFETDDDLDSLFRGKITPQKIIANLSIRGGVKISPKTTLIILDEIQSSDVALSALKYFYEEAPQFHIAAAGSLLGVKLRTQKSFPVGKVNFLSVFPLDFSEFLIACGQDDLNRLIEEKKDFSQFPAAFHNDLVQHLRNYFFVGGMPEAVAHFAEHQDFDTVRQIHGEILRAYELDFARHVPKADIAKVTALWHAIPAQLAKENKKFMYKDVAPQARARQYEHAFQWLKDAGLIYVTHQVTTPRLPLHAYKEENIFKVYGFDIGLLSSQSRVSVQMVLNGNQFFTEFKGALTENYVAQQLVQSGLYDEISKSLSYWSSSANAEVDFLFDFNDHIIPLEAKAGINSKSKSLKFYIQKYTPKIAIRTTLLNYHQQEHLVNIPLYGIGQISALMNSIVKS